MFNLNGRWGSENYEFGLIKEIKEIEGYYLSAINPYPHGLYNVFFPTGGRADSTPPIITIVDGLPYSPN